MCCSGRPAWRIQGLDWLWLAIAVLLDIASIGGAGYANRNRIPGSTQTS